jgi:hypothetical protein
VALSRRKQWFDSPWERQAQSKRYSSTAIRKSGGESVTRFRCVFDLFVICLTRKLNRLPIGENVASLEAIQTADEISFVRPSIAIRA